MTGIQLDAGARMALDVALGTAGAMGDERCGTEYLLFGVVATASGDMAELCELFALDTMRIERAVEALRGHRFEPSAAGHHDPPLSPRAELAVHRRALAGTERGCAFDLLLGCLNDPRSGASTVLRHLGVRLGEIRRLVELGAARLERSEIEGLISALDRRSKVHSAWWGPDMDASVMRVGLPNGRPQVIARSETAQAMLEGVVTGPDGFGITISMTSHGNWVLPPEWEPTELLKPGIGAEMRLAPEMVTIDLRYGDGTVITNRKGGARFRADLPTPGTLVRLGTRRVIEDRNDRRRSVHHVETTEWWIWPLPVDDTLRLELTWPAEAVSGSLELDGDAIASRASGLRGGL